MPIRRDPSVLEYLLSRKQLPVWPRDGVALASTRVFTRRSLLFSPTILPASPNSGYNVPMAFRSSAPAFSKKPGGKTPPPDDTGMEPTYLKALGEKQTPVAVKLLSGETF